MFWCHSGFRTRCGFRKEPVILEIITINLCLLTTYKFFAFIFIPSIWLLSCVWKLPAEKAWLNKHAYFLTWNDTSTNICMECKKKLLLQWTICRLWTCNNMGKNFCQLEFIFTSWVLLLLLSVPNFVTNNDLAIEYLIQMLLHYCILWWL